MHELAKRYVLAVLKVPPEPQAPSGSAASVRIFRASPNFYRLNLLKWMIAQLGAFIGIVTLIALGLEKHFPGILGTLYRIGELFGLVVLVLQSPFTYFLIRLDYEMRWYIVTDRSLRIRHGVAQVREMTMTFANVQQIVVRQGPLQRLLKIADVQVRTAGGGGSSPVDGHGGAGGDSMHLGYFRGVENAGEIRDLIIERLRRFRDTGLGDPDEGAESERAPNHEALLDASREFLEAARALRRTMT
jgi:membrane protein YdbS with pleckstrin-like domain